MSQVLRRLVAISSQCLVLRRLVAIISLCLLPSLLQRGGHLLARASHLTACCPPFPSSLSPQLYFLWTDTQVPAVLQTDNGSEFIATIVKELCEAFGVETRHGAVGNPQAQGAVERHNQILKNKISAALLEAPKINWSFQASGTAGLRMADRCATRC